MTNPDRDQQQREQRQQPSQSDELRERQGMENPHAGRDAEAVPSQEPRDGQGSGKGLGPSGGGDLSPKGS